MLFVLNKEKILSYAIALTTVVVLLGVSATNINTEEAVQTSSNSVTEKNIIVGEE